MSNNANILIPHCMKSLGNDKYQCKKYNFIITTKKLPIRCGGCSPIKLKPNEPSPPAKPEMPTLIQQAKNLGKAAVDHVKNKGRMVSAELYAARLEKCNENECGKYVEGRCAVCGCCLPIKAWSEAMNCDVGLWEDLVKPTGL